MSNGKPYSIFKRNRIYYAQFKLDNGTWSTAKSTGQKFKGHAEKWAIDYLNQGDIVIRENVAFAAFAKDFFSWSGNYAIEKQARGLRLSERWCSELNKLVERILIPAFGKYKLTDLDENIICQLPIDLYKKGFAGSYINKTLIALKAILKAAKKQKLIKFIPEIEKVANNPKVKGILTIEEAKQVFSVDWRDFRGYVGSLLAASSGLRLGELQALTLSDIHLDSNYIRIWRSWDSKFKRFNQTTKNGRARNIIIPTFVKNEIDRIIEINPYRLIKQDDIFLFFGKRSDRPVKDKVFSDSLYNALERIGIDEGTRLTRNITFHSWRHWFNSLLVNAKVPLQKIQSLTGHLSPEMTQLYYHVDDMGDVVQAVQDTLFRNR